MPNNCSYCHCQGHYSRRCNSPNIVRNFNLIKSYFIEIMRLGLNEEECGNLFKRQIGTIFNVKDIRAVASQYANIVTSMRKGELVSNIWLHLYQTIHVVPHLEPEWIEIRRRLPTVPDPIPSYAQDLEYPEGIEETEEIEGIEETEETEETEEPEVTWYIDRTPGPIPAHLTNNERSLPRTPVRAIDILTDREVMQWFEPRNLNEEFTRVATQPTKYNIMPSLLVIETSEELEKCEDCAICLEEKKLADTVTINCGHKFCGACITTTLKLHKNINAGPSCALCRAPMSSFVVKNPEIYNLVAEHCYV
jgi:hypothetical protein